MLNHSQDHEYLQSVPRPISTLAKHYPAAYVGYPHTHQRAQFLYASSGCMRVSFDEGYWMVPPRRAVWVPPQYPHQTGSIGPLEMRTLYIQPEICPANAPAVPCVLNVSQLLHELVMRAVELPLEYDEHGQDGRILATLLGEIDWRPVHAVSLPLVKDSRLQRIEHMLIANPKDRSTAEQWAIYLKLSPRSLSRLIRRETHLSFQVWRDQIRAFTAVPMLAAGTPFAEIADTLGYETAWSFTAMFKRATGQVPSRYLSRSRTC
jgi:AraC-like DNA-binding protein